MPKLSPKEIRAKIKALEKELKIIEMDIIFLDREAAKILKKIDQLEWQLPAEEG